MVDFSILQDKLEPPTTIGVFDLLSNRAREPGLSKFAIKLEILTSYNTAHSTF